MPITNNPPAINLLYNQAIGRNSIDFGYVTDGLTMFLDCKRGASQTLWKDYVGSRYAKLHNCQVTRNGLVFDGETSYATIDYSGALRTVGTIELAFKISDTDLGIAASRIWSPPGYDYVGAALFYEDANPDIKFGSIALDVRRNAHYIAVPEQTFALGDTICFSGVANGQTGPCIFNGADATFISHSAVFTNYPDCPYTTIGARDESSELRNRFFAGTIYAIRIYDRYLTADEMIANQKIDNERYNLGLTFE